MTFQYSVPYPSSSALIRKRTQAGLEETRRRERVRGRPAAMAEEDVEVTQRFKCVQRGSGEEDLRDARRIPLAPLPLRLARRGAAAGVARHS